MADIKSASTNVLNNIDYVICINPYKVLMGALVAGWVIGVFYLTY